MVAGAALDSPPWGRRPKRAEKHVRAVCEWKKGMKETPIC
jgi:hypothetical protein